MCLLTFLEMAEPILARAGPKESVDKLFIYIKLITFVVSSLVSLFGV